ncbi:PLP-dependent transferase [Nocardia amamiensis]|uniref:PLP-dependent transferase n=1 Tax=Nocardia amamiensis TaxID=404578 RepID=A0ABS0CLQ6_9NOCA|nr:PLP-dependent transferase [Nocardia amamiensis]MBF6297529.1 PLP-dependent transferase [Nocardia amamiensis]
MSESTACVAENAPAQWSFATPQVHEGFQGGTGAPIAGLPSAPWPMGGTKPVSTTFAAGSARYARVATIGDVRSLVIHPASATHPQLMPVQPAYEITSQPTRLAAGLEDIRADLCAGFAAAAT